MLSCGGFAKSSCCSRTDRKTFVRGFSINKEVEMCNIEARTVVTHRQICNYVVTCGGVTKVPVMKELL